MKKKKTFLLIIILVSVLFIPTVFAAEDCVLGPKVTKDLNGVLNILKIVGPLIVFAMTLYETIHALAKGDGGTEFKNVFNKLKMRFIYLILLIFVPTLVQLGLQAMGLTSGCELQTTNGATVGETEEQRKEQACNSHGGPEIGIGDWQTKKTECESAGCFYNHSGQCSSK